MRVQSSSESLRAYAHCTTAEDVTGVAGGVAVLLINLDPVTARNVTIHAAQLTGRNGPPPPAKGRAARGPAYCFPYVAHGAA